MDLEHARTWIVAIVGGLLLATSASTADVDLSTDIVGPPLAVPGQQVAFTVIYTNHSDVDPNACALNFEFPLGMFIDEGLTTEFSYSDSLGNLFALFQNPTCDGLLIQGAGPDATEPGLTLPAGQTGAFDLSFAMPMDAPGIPFFRIDSPALFPTGIEFGTRACDNCDDCLGPALVTIDPPIQAELVMADDGSLNPTWGCQFPWVTDVSGKIAVIRRGECEFGVKALNANDSGAVGFIILNRLDPTYDNSGVIGMLPGSFGSLVTIPGVSTTPEDGDAIENAINVGTVVGSMGAEPNSEGTLQFGSDVFHFQSGARPAETDPIPDNNRDSHTTLLLVNVAQAPVAIFTYVAADLTVTFLDESVNEPTSWGWNFGDGGSSTDQSPIHTFSAAGSYNVTLTAANDNGLDALSTFVTVREDTVFIDGFETGLLNRWSLYIPSDSEEPYRPVGN